MKFLFIKVCAYAVVRCLELKKARLSSLILLNIKINRI